MQWDHSENGGFSKTTPWLKCNPNYRHINVAENEDDPDSILNFYRRMIRFRKNHSLLVYGGFQLLMEDDPDLFVYKRFDKNLEILVVLNFSNKKRELTLDAHGSRESICLLSNYDKPVSQQGNTFSLRPWEGNIYKV